VDCGSGSSPPADAYGFASAVSVDWDATPTANSIAERRTLSEHTLEIEVLPSDPTVNPAPICVLCDHEVVGMSLRRTLSILDEVARMPPEIEEVGGGAAREVVARAPTGTGFRMPG
jgi:hypothetical protein